MSTIESSGRDGKYFEGHLRKMDQSNEWTKTFENHLMDFFGLKIGDGELYV